MSYQNENTLTSYDFGYYFHPSKQAGSPGHPQLDIHVYGQPTGQHFDPMRVNVSVIGADGNIVRANIVHPWSGEKQLRTCPGRIKLHDHKDKIVEVFSFGGKVEIEDQGSYTSCYLTSPAPIIQLTDTQDMPTTLVGEFEALLARRRVDWAGQDGEFEKRMAQIEPFTLFVAGLANIRERLDATPTELHGHRYQQASTVINHAIQIIQNNGKWPTSPPNLSDIL